MGVWSFEIDFWECFGKICMIYCSEWMKFGCLLWDKEFVEGLREILDWVWKFKNMNEIIEIYLDDKIIGNVDWIINYVIR